MLGAYITSAINKKWDDPSKFAVAIHPTGGTAISYFSSISQIDLTTSLVQIQLADLNITPVEQWIGEQWRFATGRLEHYQVQCTLKDYDNFTLYKTFSAALQAFTREYPKDQMFDIQIKTAPDYDPENYQDIIIFKNCMLISVAGPTLNHSSNASIAEFSFVAKAQYVETFM